MKYRPIEDYAVIGDLHTAALVSKGGAIDYMTFPRFDSPTVFAALLDADKGGCFWLEPLLSQEEEQKVTRRQLYLPDSNILLTRFLSEEGVAELSDFMPIREGHRHRVVRRVKIIRGEVRFRLLCAPRFDYARAAHTAQRCDEGVRFASGDLTLLLRSAVELEVKGDDAVAEFTLQAGETASFVLEEDTENSPAADASFASESFKETLNFWQAWVNRSTYGGRWREEMRRSALALKLLTYAPEGSIVAAATMGLPEEEGGERNWDYRYTWIRDASFTVYGLSRLGYTDEMADFMAWISKRAAECIYVGEDGLLQALYGISGEREIPEQNLTHLEGYKGSAPVRLGNSAYDQLQLDVYGTLMDSVYLYNKYGEPISFDLWQHLIRMIDWVCENWWRKDHGIWEVRSGQQEFLYSRLMCWVAVDRGFRLAHKRSFPAPLERWHKVRDEIYYDIFENFWDEDRGAFIQYKGSRAVDASSLLMPLVKFVSPNDPKWLSTLKVIEDELVEESLVYRYHSDDTDDGLRGKEGTFNICSFWYIECLARSGDVAKARLLFEKFLGYANHVGLFSEEIGPYGQQLGNFPQAFTHLGLISAAFELDRRLA